METRSLPYFPKLAGIDAAYAEKKLAAFREVSPPSDELFFLVLKLAGAKKDPANVSHQADFGPPLEVKPVFKSKQRRTDGT